MDDGISFGRWLKQRRRALDLTQEALAERVGCAAETIRKLEAGRRPSRDVADRILVALDVPTNEHAALIGLARAAAPRPPALRTPARTPPDARFESWSVPLAPVPLVGRARDVAEVCAMLQRPPVRLVTLVGPPGIGKTRLALQCAAELQPAFSGAVLLSLAPISAAQHVGMAIAHAFGIGETQEQPLSDAVTAHLRDTTVLLVLDNFEHLVAAAPFVAELLARAPGLKVLATSRVPLHLLAEHQYAVRPLALPDLQHVPPLEQVVEIAAVQMFVQRARAAQHDFSLSDGEGPIVAEICVRLAGIPLALELAAARAKFFPLPDLLKRLRQPLDMLTHGARDMPLRQQTLRDAIAWSYELLTHQDQQLFQRLGVFVGGWTSDAARAVGNQDARRAFDVDAGVLSLRDTSLLEQQIGVDGEPRYGMLELLRDFAVERLNASGDEQAVRRCHAAYFLALVERTEHPSPERPPQVWFFRTPAWVARMEAEHANVQAALAWAVDHQPEVALRLVAAVWPYWNDHALYSIGQAWLERCLATTEHEPSWERAQAMLAAGVLAAWQGRYAQARSYVEAALARFEALGEQHWAAFAINALAITANRLGDAATAQRLWLQSLGIFRALGNTPLVALVLNNLGDQAFGKRDYKRARTLLEESLALFRQLSTTSRIFMPLSTLADVALVQGDDAQAEAYYGEVLVRLWERRNRLFLDVTLDGLAMARWAQAHDAETAAHTVRLFGAAAALRTATNVQDPAADAWQARYADTLSATRSTLGAARFAALWAEGQALTLERAVAEALERAG